MVVDTNVFVDYLRESVDAKEFLMNNDKLLTSVVVVAEIIAGFDRKSEVSNFEKLLESLSCSVVQINQLVSKKGLNIFKEHYIGKGIGFEDCLIAATALDLDEPLVTLNVKHFRFIDGLDVVKPY